MHVKLNTIFIGLLGAAAVQPAGQPYAQIMRIQERGVAARFVSASSENPERPSVRGQASDTAGRRAYAQNATRAAQTIRIAVNQMEFDPPRVSAHVGDTIEWANSDTVAHTATERPKGWDVALPVKGNGRLVLTAAGEIDYYCRFHPAMVGHVSVTE